MHMVIRVLVSADSQESALDEAKMVLDNLCGEGLAFDYSTTFDEEGTTVSGKARWGPLPAAVTASSPEGQELIRVGMEYTRRALLENLARIRHGLQYLSDEEIWQDVEKQAVRSVPGVTLQSEAAEPYEDRMCLLSRFLRFTMGQVGRHSGPSIYLYDQDGEGIRDPGHLQRVLDEWGRPDQHPGDLWVVPADVHF